MPSLTQEPSSYLASRKRRRGDNSSAGDHHQSFPQSIQDSQTLFAVSLNDHNNVFFSNDYLPLDRLSHDQDPLIARKIMPLPITKRVRLNDEDAGICPSTGEQPRRTPEPRHSKSPSKELQQTSGNSRPGISRTTSAALLSPCHICHRRPTKKSDLDAFADCQGCGQRTCYVCIRACPGWKQARQRDEKEEEDEEVLGDRPGMTPEGNNFSSSFHMEDAPSENDPQAQDAPFGGGGGVHTASSQCKSLKTEDWATGGGGHRQTICSRCCVEQGSDGEVVCLGCLPFVEG